MHSFAAAGESLQRLADAMASLVLAPDAPLWRSSSRAAREAQQEPAFAGAWGERPLEEAVLAANLALEVAHSHLLGMAALFHLDDVLTAPVTLGRTVSTACARSYWLLDPAADARERVRRVMNVRLESVAEAAELRADDGQVPTRLTAISRAVTETATAHGFAVETERARRGRAWQLQYLDHKIPNEMALVRDLLGSFGDAHFRLSSAAVHAQSHGLNLLDLGPGEAGGPTGLRVDLPALLLQTGGAVWGAFKAGLRSMEHAGVPTYRWERLALPIVRDWEGGMRAGLSER